MEKHFQELMEILKKNGVNINDSVGLLRNEKELKGILKKVMKNFSQDDFDKLFKMLKKVGFLLEQKANEAIQGALNKKEVLKDMHEKAQKFAPLIRDLKDWVETVSVPLNLPTKNDVANVANLTLQNGERLESIEEQFKLLNQKLDNAPAVSQPSENERKMELKQKKILLLQKIIEQSTNLTRRD